MDEAGRATQPPLIMTPPGPETDPDAQAEDAIVDNGTMSSSRTRSGSSRSGAARRAGGANGTTASANGSAASETSATTEDPAGSTPDPVVPLPAETAGPAKAGTVGTGRTPPPTRAEQKLDDPARSSPYPGPAAGYSASGYSGTGYLGSGSPTAGSSASGSRPAGNPAGSSSAAGTRPPAGTSAFSSVSSFSSGAAAAVSGAAAGVASSVASVFGKRGTGSQWQAGSAPRRPAKRQAMLTLARVEPWSVMKFSFVASVVAFIILFVAVALLYLVLSALGVFDSLQNQVSSITSSQDQSGTNISHWFSAPVVLGYTAMLGALNIVLITAISTVGSVIYNLIAKTTGGIEVTLRETD